jgi:outer membrane protein OmpA-like peptidoglycan-associated protein
MRGAFGPASCSHTAKMHSRTGRWHQMPTVVIRAKPIHSRDAHAVGMSDSVGAFAIMRMALRVFTCAFGLNCLVFSAPSAQPEPLTVFFAPNSSVLTEEALWNLRTFVDERNAKCPLFVELTGHVDASEARVAPILLDIERAQAVARELRRLVTTAWTIKVDGAHVSQQRVLTGLGVSEEQNRRVEVCYEHVPASGFLECGPPVKYRAQECVLTLEDGTRCRGYPPALVPESYPPKPPTNSLCR